MMKLGFGREDCVGYKKTLPHQPLSTSCYGDYCIESSCLETNWQTFMYLLQKANGDPLVGFLGISRLVELFGESYLRSSRMPICM